MSNGRGSLMVYVPTPEGHVPWYVEISQKDTWRPTVTNGITISDLRHYMGASDAKDAVKLAAQDGRSRVSPLRQLSSVLSIK